MYTYIHIYHTVTHTATHTVEHYRRSIWVDLSCLHCCFLAALRNWYTIYTSFPRRQQQRPSECSHCGLILFVCMRVGVFVCGCVYVCCVVSVTVFVTAPEIPSTWAVVSCCVQVWYRVCFTMCVLQALSQGQVEDLYIESICRWSPMSHSVLSVHVCVHVYGVCVCVCMCECAL